MCDNIIIFVSILFLKEVQCDSGSYGHSEKSKHI